MKSFWGIYFIIILNTNFLFSQELFFKNISIEDGLPSSEVYCTFQDSKGFVWITTDAGICRFDGKNMQTFTTKDGLPENIVFSAYEDYKGRVWFNCLSGPLFYYQNGKINCIKANSELKILCKKNYIIKIFIGENDTLYAETKSVLGLLKISPENNYKNIYYQQFSQKYHTYIIPNKLKKTEFIVASTIFRKAKKTDINNLFSYFSGKDYEFYLKGEGLTKFYADTHQNLYYTSGDYLYKFLPNGNVHEYRLPAYIHFVKMDGGGNLWIGTQEGVLFYKDANLDDHSQTYLEGAPISSLMIDNEGSFWFSTLQKGIYLITNDKIKDILSENAFISSFNNEDNRLDIVYDSKKTIQFDSTLAITASIGQIESKGLAGKIKSFFKKGDYTFYSTMDGMYYKHGNSANFIKNSNYSILAKKIISIGKDSFAAMCPAVTFLFEKSHNYQSIENPFAANTIFQLKNKTILIGSRNNSGIYKIDGSQLIPYFEEFPDLKTRINCIKEDINGNVWIATNEKGLFCISGYKLIQYSTSNGMVSDKINVLDIDNNGSVWLGTNLGISKISSSGKIYNFNKSHGLPGQEIEHLSIFNNHVFCGSREHVFYFNINNLEYNTVNPYVYITSVKINSSPFEKNNDSLLKYNQNNVEFTFTSTTYKNLWKQEFEYKLNGYDKEWKYTKSGLIQYTNLPAGKYQFQVFALNNDRLKSLKPAFFSFSIDKPYWLKWWFILFETVIIILLLFLFVRWRINKIRKNEKEKTELNKKMSEFQMTAIRAQMNPHFIFNAITSIQHYILKSDVYQSYNYLAKFAKLIRNILDSSKEEFISIADEINALNLYIELEKIRFKEPFDSKIEVMDGLDIDSILIPTMIMQPYIENAIWHGLLAKKDGQGKLLISFKEKNDMLEIIIEDDGIGINESAKNGRTKHISKGLELTKMRLHGLSENNTKQSTVEIIDLSTTPNHRSGTRITITIPIILN